MRVPSGRSLSDSDPDWFPLFHLDGPRRFARQVILHTTDPVNFVHNSSRNPLQKLPIKSENIRGHEIRRLHSSQRNHLLMHSLVSHDAHCLHRQQRRERLADLVIQARSSDLFDEDIVCLPCNGHLLACDLTQNPDGDAWAREGMAHH